MSGSNSSAPGSSVVGVPADPVSFTVHSMPDPRAAASDASQQRRTALGRLKMLMVLLVCASPVIASYFTYFVIRPQGRTNYSTLIQPVRELPAALPLANLEGQPVPATSLKGQWLLVVVGDAACSEACEKRLFLQRQLREMMGRERERIDKLFIVDDVAALRPELREALAATPPATVLRAPRDALAQWLAPEAGQPLEAHLYIVDPMGNWMMRAPADPDPAKLKKDLERLLRGSSSWDQPGR
ncbi:hypothetical protein V4F39_12700 [Aquincola sp. MAHUQ-54]|uniref:Cytochrome oxidase Cu insertion factor (SCO1/SenC/PrrC family) n=1 Tax=Aquincola agrisoli TaxID=3119538 RepID=A0AAW9QGL1_9BURK